MTNDLKNTKTVFVTLAGRSNVGKSTLINKIIGNKISIVSPKPQTTIKSVTAVKTVDNIQYVFLDTPGLHTAKSTLGDTMVKNASQSVKEADVVLFVISALDKPQKHEKDIINLLKQSHKPAFLIINKIDKFKKEAVLETIDSFSKLFDFSEVIPISALKNDGVDLVLSCLSKYAKPSMFFYDTEFKSDLSDDMFICETVREKMLLYLNQEIPHGVCLLPYSFEQDERLIRCEINVYCIKPSHKSIIIGQNGSMLKKISTAARLELEKHFNKKVFISCYVRVKPDWQNNMSLISSLGL